MFAVLYHKRLHPSLSHTWNGWLLPLVLFSDFIFCSWTGYFCPRVKNSIIAVFIAIPFIKLIYTEKIAYIYQKVYGYFSISHTQFYTFSTYMYTLSTFWLVYILYFHYIYRFWYIYSAHFMHLFTPIIKPKCHIIISCFFKTLCETDISLHRADNHCALFWT